VRNVIKRINYYSQFISGFVLAGLMLLTVADVVARKIFTVYVVGTYELTIELIVYIVFFSIAYAHDNKEHVVIDVVYEALPFIGKRILSVIATFLNLAIAALMCYFVFRHGLNQIVTKAQTSSLKIPHWPTVILASVGLFGYVLSLIGDLILIFKEKRVLSNDAG
jgi:TRAP-type C4-dicarboxylate transport system permease small subunit